MGSKPTVVRSVSHPRSCVLATKSCHFCSPWDVPMCVPCLQPPGLGEGWAGRVGRAWNSQASASALFGLRASLSLPTLLSKDVASSSGFSAHLRLRFLASQIGPLPLREASYTPGRVVPSQGTGPRIGSLLTPEILPWSLSSPPRVPRLPPGRDFF